MGVDLTQTTQVDYISGYEDVGAFMGIMGPCRKVRVARRSGSRGFILASDLSAFVTGHNIPVDGGSHAGGGWMVSLLMLNGLSIVQKVSDYDVDAIDPPSISQYRPSCERTSFACEI